MSSAWRALKSWSTSARRLNLSVRWAHPFPGPCCSLMYFLSFPTKPLSVLLSDIHTAFEPEHYPQASSSSVLPLPSHSCQPSHEGACPDLHLSSWRTESTVPQEKGKNANLKLTGFFFLVHKYLFLSCRYSHSSHSRGDLWSVVNWQHWTSTTWVQNGKSWPGPSTCTFSMTVCSCLGPRSECFNTILAAPSKIPVSFGVCALMTESFPSACQQVAAFVKSLSCPDLMWVSCKYVEIDSPNS